MKAHPNFRAVRSLATLEGRVVRPDTLFRSGALRALDADDAAELDGLGFAAVCDLRSASESEHAPNDWLASQTVPSNEFDVLAAIPAETGPWPRLAADPTPTGARLAMLALYEAMPAAAGTHVVTILRTIAAGSVPVLIHCTAGKDRTGFVVGLLLRAIGVPAEAVINDYMLSAGRQNPAAVAASKRLAEERIEAVLDDATVAILMGVEPAFLEASFAVIDRDYGGIEPYLFTFGADSALLAAVRGRLLA